jgi:hypothetical protein
VALQLLQLLLNVFFHVLSRAGRVITRSRASILPTTAEMLILSSCWGREHSDVKLVFDEADDDGIGMDESEEEKLILLIAEEIKYS